MTYKEKYKNWCENSFFDEETKKELLSIENDEKEIEDRFYKDLEFGTAGLRGIIGMGTNRMNKYTVGKATQGLANFIIEEKAVDRGVVISYDSRNMSKEFGELSALILNANGIKTYLFEGIRPVPELSYAVRKLNAISGIMITASHNPPKYNGYKVYWEDGAQITSPKDKLIIEKVNSIEDYSTIKKIEKEEAIKKGLYNIIGKEIDNEYINTLKSYILNENVIKENKNISIVYTPLHGTGYMPVTRILKEVGFEKVNVVEEQCIPDGNFPTVEYPNPEDKKAFKMALDLANKKNAELVLATDPDADRLGVYSLDTKTGEYKAFTGNMSAMLIAEYILSQKKEKNILDENSAMVKSIVSTNLAEAIAKEYSIKLFSVLTGFKYIGEKIKEFEQTNKYKYVFGFEESYGCLIGDYARDKDGIAAVMALCEAAAYYKSKGLTLWDQMIKIYEKYGFYQEKTISITLEGVDGIKQIKDKMDKLRKEKVEKFANFDVIKIKDYKLQEEIDLKTGKIKKLEMPESNVLYYELVDDAWVCVRPSGTEPKIKYYIGVKGKSFEDSENKIQEIEKFIKEM